MLASGGLLSFLQVPELSLAGACLEGKPGGHLNLKM